MSSDSKFYVGPDGKYLGAMSGELLDYSLHPYPEGLEVPSAPASMMERWDFEEGAWVVVEVD